MSDKQLTGTITLPGVDPDLYEPDVEFRQAEFGETYSDGSGEILVWGVSRPSTLRYHILRRKPRKIRVTPTQADLDAATEPIPCWVRLYKRSGPWNAKKLHAIDKFSPLFIDEDGGGWDECEIEKEVTERP